jgi:hypothetical protein
MCREKQSISVLGRRQKRTTIMLMGKVKCLEEEAEAHMDCGHDVCREKTAHSVDGKVKCLGKEVEAHVDTTRAERENS